MSVLTWIQYTEPVVGLNHPTLPDVANRALRQLLTASGYNPDADIGTGFAKTSHTQPFSSITGGVSGPYAFTFQSLVTFLSNIYLYVDAASGVPYTTSQAIGQTSALWGFNCTGGALTATLPAVASFPGMPFIMYKTDATANALNIALTDSTFIDGTVTKNTIVRGVRFFAVSNGVQWVLV